MTLRSKKPSRRPLGPVLPLEDRVVPATAFALSNNSLLAFDTANPAAAGTSVAITGLAAADTLVGIDVRPVNGFLYGLGVDAAADTATLYAISARTGTATAVGAAGGLTADDGVTPIDLPDPAVAGYGVDFNPVADRLRVVTSTGLNFRIDPNTGAAVDADGGVNGTQPDVGIGGDASGVDATAYTNNSPVATATTQYTLDSATDTLYIQSPPNSGTNTARAAITLGGSPLDFTAANGFDIPAGVTADANGDPANGGAAFAVLTVGGQTGLYRIDLSAGAEGVATLVGPVAGPVQGFAVASDQGGLPAVALSGGGTVLTRSVAGSAAAGADVNITGVDAGEVLVGIDFRPATGQLFGLGVNDAANTATLYLIDPVTGAATAVGAVGGIALTQADEVTPVDLPAAAAGYGFDFNPVVDRLRVVAGNGINFRINPNTGLAVDADAGLNGTQADADLSGGATLATGAAYTNSFGGAAATTLYVLDPDSDSLFIQGAAAPGPNGGVLSAPLPISLGGAALDFSAVNGFDIAPGVRVGTSGTAAAGRAFARLTVGADTGLYSIDLATGVATLVTAGAGSADGLAVGDAPAGTVTVGPGTFAASEADPTFTFDLVRTDGGNGPLTVTVAVTGGTATEGADFTAPPATVTFADGQTTATVTVPILDDQLLEGAETIELTVTDPTNGGVLGSSTPITITLNDNDLGGEVQFAAPTFTVAEDGATGILTLTRTGGLGGPVTVNVAVTGGTATEGVDFTAPPVTVTFLANQTEAQVTVPIIDDTLDEADETVEVTISAPTGGATLGTQTTATLTIADNDVAGAISISTVTPVDEAAGTFNITLTRAGGSAGEVSVTLSTAGTATAGDDFTAPTTLTLADGVATQTFAVTVAQDTIDEADETIEFTISAPTGGATIDVATATTTITDDDTAGAVAFTADAFTVAEDGGSVDVTLTRTGGLAGPVSVTLTATGTAAAGDDFTAPPTTVTFAAGETTATVNIPILNDILFEGPETIVLTLTDPTGGGTLGAPAVTTVTITDDETAPPAGLIAFDPAAVTIDEAGGTATLTLTRTGGSVGAVTVTLTLGGTATSGIDFVPPTLTVDFADGDAAPKTVTIPILDDADAEGDETVVVTIDAVTGGAAIGSAGTVTITDNDGAGQFAFTAPTFTVGEAGPEATVTLTRTGGSVGAVDLTLTATGTATAGSDFTAPATTVSFAAGETTKTVTIPILQDTVFEGDETLILTLSAPTNGGTLGAQASVTGTITDDEPAPAAGAITFAVASATIAETGGTLNVVVNRVGGTTGAVAVTLTATGTATAGDDFTAPPVTVNFADGETTQTVQIPIAADAIDEDDETIILTLTDPTNGAQLGNTTVSTATITDTPRPGAIAFSAPTFTVGEGGTTVNLTLTRTGGTDGAVTVDLTVFGGSATAGADFTAPATTVTFAAGADTATVAIPVTDDALVEGDETVEFVLSNVTGGATIGNPAAATLTITDNDVAPPPAGEIAFGAATFTVGEAGGSLSIPLTRTGGTEGAVTVTVTVSGTATAGADFGTIAATVTFAAGADAATLTIPITNDTVPEGSETIVLTLSDPTGGAALGVQATTTVTITDDDPIVEPPVVPADNLVTVGGQPNGQSQTFRVGATGALTAVGTPTTPFPGFSGTVRSTTADVNADGVLDTIYVTGPGTPIRMTVLSGATGNAVLVPPTAPFAGSEDFTGGGYVAAADLDGDGRAEWAVTPDEGGGPRVTIFSLPTTGTTPTVRANFLGIDNAAFRGGARPALGDVNNDGTPDLAVAAGFLGGPQVALFNGTTLIGRTPTRLVGDFFAFPGDDATRLRNGAFVAIGDVTGDGFGDLVFGGGPGGAPRVFILNGQQVLSGNVQAAYNAPVANFFVGGNTTDRGGVRVSTADQNGDGRADVVVGSGAGSPARVRTYLGTSFTAGQAGEPTGFQDLTPFGGAVLTDGIFVG